MPTITCPMCQGAVTLPEDEAAALCSDCHDMTDQQLADELEKRVERAVHIALRAVEDKTTYARWLREQGKPVNVELKQAEEAARLLREVLSRGVRATDRPASG